MVQEGLKVIIKYRGAKYDQVASPTTSSFAFAILKKDLTHLRVHSPSQKNVERENGSFILHWPTASLNPKVEGLADSLYTRWRKLCSDDPEALTLREFLSIESITLTQDGVLIRSTLGAKRVSQDVPPGSFAGRRGDPLPDIAQQPVPLKPQASLSLPLPPPPLPRLLPGAPELDKQLPHLKRRMSTVEGPSSPTRQKLDVPDAQATIPLPSTNTQHQQSPPISSRAERRPESFTLGDAAKLIPQFTPDDTTHLMTHVHAPTLPISPDFQPMSLSPQLEPGEMTPPPPLPDPTPVSGHSPLGSGSRPRLHPASPHPSPPPSGNGDHASRRRDRDVGRLTRELWETRRQLTDMQAREQVILDDLERLGARPESAGAGAGAGADQNGVSRDELLRLEAELTAERTRRTRAERALSDVERECRAPFVVPALFQAFVSISELSS